MLRSMLTVIFLLATLCVVLASGVQIRNTCDLQPKMVPDMIDYIVREYQKGEYMNAVSYTGVVGITVVPFIVLFSWFILAVKRDHYSLDEDIGLK